MVKMAKKKELEVQFKSQERSFLTIRKCYFIVFVTSFLCYANTLDAQFVYDDNRCILTNQDLLPSSPWTNVFYNDFWGTPLSHSGSHKSYRPLCILSFRLNFALGKFDPWGYHFVNVVLHSIVSCLFAYLCFMFFEDEIVGLIGGLLFGFHPIHTEAVAGIVGRADIGAALFFLSSLIVYIKVTKDASNVSFLELISSLLFCLASTLTKEQGFTVLGVLIAYEILFVSKCNLAYPRQAFSKLKSTNGIQRISLILTFAAITLYIRFLIMENSLPDFSPADNPASNDPNVLTRVLTFLYLPFCNFWLLLCPASLSYDYSTTNVPLVKNVFSLEIFFSAILYTFLFSCGCLYLIYFRNYLCTGAPCQTCDKFCNNKHHEQFKNRITKKHDDNNNTIHFLETKNENKNVNTMHGQRQQENTNTSVSTLNIMLLGFAMLILPFLPATNMFFYVGFIIAERILYMPSIGYCFLVANGINLLLKRYTGQRKQIFCVVAVVLILFSLKTFSRNYVWENEETLYRSGLTTSPAKSYGNLANILIKNNKLDEAEHAYRTALKFRYNMADTHYNLCTTHINALLAKALVYSIVFQNLPEMNSVQFSLLTIRGILLQNQNRYDEAIQCYQDAIKYRPRLAAAHLNLGVTLMVTNRLEDALSVLRNASEISDHGLKDPLLHAKSLTSIRYNMGKVLFELQRYEEAIEVFLNAIKRMPDTYEPHSVYNMLGQCYTALKNPQFAGPWYIRALHEKPDHVPALLTCARHYHESGGDKDWNYAKEHLNKALVIEPKRMETYLMYARFLQERRKHNSALSLLKKALEVDDKNVQVLTFISTMHRDKKDYETALEYQLMAVDADHQEFSTLINLGALYHVAGKLKEAETVYTKALSKDPTNEILLANIGKLKRAMAV